MFLRISHRGAVEFAPENTLTAFKKAVELGANAIECDVHGCKSGEIMVIHDETVDRTTNGSGLISEKTYDELRKLNAGSREKIPTLLEVLDIVEKSILVNIELKNKNIIHSVCKLVNDQINLQNYSFDKFLISSFSSVVLRVISDFYPSIKTGLLVEHYNLDAKNEILYLQPYAVCIDFQCVTKGIVEQVHELGSKILVWTVNDYKDIKRMKSLNVDGIFSDYPNRL
ncbi:MAG: glycerophosphodiester phosphodiesterase [Candidatus Marinimicrobia bacterium]|nr:glycerophosphodiester phosphodiesterase [Candidatus Neomarinimicrobiota bacterium]MBL7022520.1 glycerophosphodiester phosphodiesterase [Candidatus Neomarinimicrobiota bacterium]MBL7108625.1 glycerophosphodiester phosphodiesterase [Candidatus Neomarinimicrobiota bacterium]